MPDSFQDYKNQRFRWAYGAMQILRRHAGVPDVALDFITAGKHCSAQDCPHLTDTPRQDPMSYLDQYYSLIAHASE